MKAKKLPILGVIVFSLAAGKSMADCGSGPFLDVGALETLIAGNTVCASLGGDQWQEQHRGGPISGELWDYKKGPDDPVDPTKQVGNWQLVAGSSRSPAYVRYTYLGGSGYNYRVNGSGSLGTPHNFCGAFDGGVDIANAVLKAGVTSCQ